MEDGGFDDFEPGTLKVREKKHKLLDCESGRLSPFRKVSKTAAQQYVELAESIFANAFHKVETLEMTIMIKVGNVKKSLHFKDLSFHNPDKN